MGITLCNCQGDFHDEAYCEAIIKYFCETWSAPGQTPRAWLQYVLPEEGQTIYAKYGWKSRVEDGHTLVYRDDGTGTSD